MAKFDDVFDLLQIVIEELERVPESTRPIAPSSWEFHSARFEIENPLGVLTHRQAMMFLWGLQQSGFEVGYWEGYMAFYDSAMTETRRGTGFLGHRTDG